MTHRALKHLDYHNWANQRVLSHLKSLPEELFTREIQSVFQSVSEVVTHMCVADALWLKVISGAAYEEAKETGMRLKEMLKGKRLMTSSPFFKTRRFNMKRFLKILKTPMVKSRLHIRHSAKSKRLLANSFITWSITARTTEATFQRC